MSDNFSRGSDEFISKVGSLHPPPCCPTTTHTGIYVPRPRCSAPPDRSQSGPDYTGIRTSLLTTRNPGDDPQQSWGEPTGSRGEAGFLARVCTSNHVFLIRMLIKLPVKPVRYFWKRSTCSPVLVLARSSSGPNRCLPRSHWAHAGLAGPPWLSRWPHLLRRLLSESVLYQTPRQSGLGKGVETRELLTFS